MNINSIIIQRLADELKGVLDIYAVNTAPLGITIKQSNIPDAGCGAFVTHHLAQDVRLGPYEGKTVKLKYEHEVQENGFAWLVFDDNDKPSHYIDASDDSRSSWMRYVNCARVFEEQNLMAFQYLGNIYYRTIRPIQAGEELLVWYGDEYAKELGIVHQQEKNVKICVELEKPSENMVQAKQRLCDWRQHGSKIQDVPKFFPVPEPKGFQCDVCSTCFTTAEFLDKHKTSSHWELRKTGREKYTCQYCQFASNNESHVIRHERTHTGEKPHVCTVCSKRFTQAGNLKRHMLTHTGDRPHECSTCGKRFSRISDLKRHKQTHAGKMFCCLYCDKKFTRQGHLKRHVSAVHSGEKNCQCQNCNYKCAQSNDLKWHILRYHSSDTTYACHVCDKNFKDSRDLKRHILNVHKEDLPYGCELCSERFVFKSQLHRHMLQYHYTHLTDQQRQQYTQSARNIGVIPEIVQGELHTSNIADENQSQNTKERKDVKDVSTKKCASSVGGKHECTECGKSFTRPDRLKSHVITVHTKDYPLHCSVCNKGAVTNTALRRHMKTHGEETRVDVHTSQSTHVADSQTVKVDNNGDSSNAAASKRKAPSSFVPPPCKISK